MRLCLFVLVFTLTASPQNQFKPNGDPFHNFEKPTAFDSNCTSVIGTADPTKGDAVQNEVKNNFAAKGPAAEITVADLVALEKEIEQNPDFKNWGDGKEPKSRAPFSHMSGKFQEGQMVRLTAYVFEAHAADTRTGESVNCGFGTEPKSKHVVSDMEVKGDNDIHIALVESRTEINECKSVTAEAIPHFRVAAWDESLFNTTLKKKLVRLTGQLFFDSSHKPCTTTKKESPARQSLWEVHPLYQVEQCTKDDGNGNCTGQWKVIS